MEIVYKKTSELIPYENNPRNNDGAVDAVAESIQEFGFKVPLVIDKNNVVVTGHTRLKASKKLGIREVPCIIADDLTEEQTKAFRLVDNKTNELAEWDHDLLVKELEQIDIDMEEFGFELEPLENIEFEQEDDQPKENERVKTFEAYNMELYDPFRASGKWQMPIIENNHYVPDRLIGFNYAKTSEDKHTGIHFFIDDYQFERCWNNPSEYVPILKEYDCVLTPDFSLYLDMALPVKIWNVYRSRLLGQYWQKCGIKVIPTMQWADVDTFAFCFEGIPEGSIVAVSTIGVKRENECFEVFSKGMNRMIQEVQPSIILWYGGKVDYQVREDIEVMYFENEVTERMKGYK